MLQASSPRIPTGQCLLLWPHHTCPFPGSTQSPPAPGEALTGGASRHLDDAFGFPAHLPGVEGPDAHCHLHRCSRHGAGRPWVLLARSSGCPAKGREEKGVRKTHIPIHVLQPCRVSGKPAQGILLGMLFCPWLKNDILFHTSICPAFTSSFSLAYLRSGPPRGHPCPYPRAALEPPSPCSITWWAPPAADRAL